MRLVHLSDLHLGFRQYQRLTPAGINQREADVAAAFCAAIESTIALQPDLIVFGGDIFHTVRPTNPAILLAFRQIAKLRDALPAAAIVMVAGNHDTPRSAETGCILRLFEQLGVHVADAAPRTFLFPELDLSVLAVPDAAGVRETLVPDRGHRYNVLVVHGEVEGVLPRGPSAERAVQVIPLAALAPARWSYVALGHYHVFREIAPNAFYSGSVEYSSQNIWGELQEERAAGLAGKGIVEYDLDRGIPIFHALAAPRVFIDLPSFSARGMTAADVDSRISESVEGWVGGIEGKVVRLVVHEIPRHIARELDHRALRDYRRRALHFLLDPRRPELQRVHGQGTPGRRPSLIDTVRDKLWGRVLESDIDRSKLVELGLRYLREAERVQETEGTAAVGIAERPE